MDRGERRHRTERTINRRVRARVLQVQELYSAQPIEPWRSRFVHRVKVGNRTRWTFYEWLVRPGILRKVNGAHGSCWVCERQENPRLEQPSLGWELEQIADLDRRAPDAYEPRSSARRRRKNTKIWCRGKVDVPHQSSWQPTRSGSDSYELVCSCCGKKLDWCCHPRGWPVKEPCRCGRSANRAANEIESRSD